MVHVYKHPHGSRRVLLAVKWGEGRRYKVGDEAQSQNACLGEVNWIGVVRKNSKSPLS